MVDYSKKWIAAGYPEKMGSAVFLPPPPNKFLRAYHFTSKDYGICSVALRRLKVARFSDANDPFELMCLNLRDKSIRESVKDFKKARNKEMGLVCFTENWTDPLLWSHYAAKHAGVCLGFDLNRELVSAVSYEPDRVPARLGNGKGGFVIDKELEKRLLLTKSRHWQYEQERRLLISLSDATKEGELYFQPFNKDMRLSEVILGERCGLKPDNISHVIRATNPGAIVFRARLEFGGFRVIRNGSDLPSIAKALAEG